MTFLNDIDNLENISKKTKKQKILEVKNEILVMIKKQVSLPCQIQLLVKNEIIDSIDLKYYRNILKKEFAYKNKKFKSIKNKNLEINQLNRRKNTKAIIDILSEDINLNI